MKLSGLFTSVMLLFSNMTNVTSQDICMGDIDNNMLIDKNKNEAGIGTNKTILNENIKE